MLLPAKIASKQKKIASKQKTTVKRVHALARAAGEAQAAARMPRQDNRRVQLLDAAARLFASYGFHATSMRDIAKAVDMLSGSIYYHFNSKQEMLLAVYAEGARRIGELVDGAATREIEPWKRLEAASAAHLNALSITHRDYAQVMIRTLPQEADGISQQLREIRRDYESKFRRLIDGLPLPADVDRHYLRLMLILRSTGRTSGTTQGATGQR